MFVFNFIVKWSYIWNRDIYIFGKESMIKYCCLFFFIDVGGNLFIGIDGMESFLYGM